MFFSEDDDNNLSFGLDRSCVLVRGIEILLYARDRYKINNIYLACN